MRIIAVDDNGSDLLKLKSAIKAACPGGILSSFSSMDDALSYAGIYTVHVAFIETTISGRSGFELVEWLQKSNSWTNIIFVTAGGYYAVESYSVYASGYVLKLVTPEVITKELRGLRYPLSDKIIPDKERWLTIKTRNSEMAIPYDELYCAVYSKREVQFDIFDMKPLIERVSQSQFNKAVSPLTEDEKFLKIGKTALVNMEYIDEVTDDSFVLYSGREIKIPINEYAGAKKRYSDFVEKHKDSGEWETG